MRHSRSVNGAFRPVRAAGRNGGGNLNGLRALPVAVVAAVALGLTATVAALQGEPPFGAVQIGPWGAWPSLGDSTIDPYARAVIAVDGALPLGSGEGLTFIARTDDSGEALDARCDYRLSGGAPSARFWTLSAYDIDGRLRPNAANRYSLTSAALLREAGGAFAIEASREARPGNWLPLGEKSRFVLVLRAYQLTTSAVAGAFEGLVLPTIVRGDCS
jgi:hypothetical protein